MHTDNPSATNHLNANPDPKHFSYKVLGLLSWGILVSCLVNLVVAPRLLLNVARVVAIYMMIRFIAFMFLYLIGLLGIRTAEKRAMARSRLASLRDENVPSRTVHHLVVLPNYEEPVEILDRTLRSLTSQAKACQTITVVLAMEEREPGARSKAEALVAKYKSGFHGMMATFHPADLPGEAPGKGVNESWAVHCGRKELVDRMGIPIDRVIVTVIDSDSRLHPGYLAELTRRFQDGSRRHSLVWQAPIFLDNDIWQCHAAIRLVTFFSNAISTGDYFNPWEARFPYSTYSIGLKLLEEVNYWDPTVMTEDVNIFMRAFFKKGGRAFVERIYLPVHGNPTYGADLWHAIRIFYSQKVRQGWGGAEIGYMLQKWNYKPGTPFFYKLGRFLKLVHDHLFFSTAGFVVALGTVLSIWLDHSAVITFPPSSFSPLLFTILNLLGGFALVVIWFVERVRLSRDWSNWSFKTLASEIVSLAIIPVLFLLLTNLPGLQAQAQMFLGQSINFTRTPKGFNSKFSE